MNFIKTQNENSEIISYKSNSNFYTILNLLENSLKREYVNLCFDFIESHSYFGIEFDYNKEHFICALTPSDIEHFKIIKKIIRSFNI